jgi:hypothetical protein
VRIPAREIWAIFLENKAQATIKAKEKVGRRKVENMKDREMERGKDERKKEEKGKKGKMKV